MHCVQLMLLKTDSRYQHLKSQESFFDIKINKYQKVFYEHQTHIENSIRIQIDIGSCNIVHIQLAFGLLLETNNNKIRNLNNISTVVPKLFLFCIFNIIRKLCDETYKFRRETSLRAVK